MKNLDLISKRILVISLSISAVLLSACLLIFASRPANAQTSLSNSSRMDDGRRYDAVTNGSSYFIWNTQSGTYRVATTTGYANSDFYLHDRSSLEEKFW